nr:CPBP family intramembrane glutamic endopeptidase [uncultured Lacibacter sp.]
MPVNFAWDSVQTDSFVAITYTALGFAVYWFIATDQKLQTRFYNHQNADAAQINYAVFQKLTGVLFLGIIPAIYFFAVKQYSFADLGLQWGNYKTSLIYILVMGVLIVTLNYFASNKPDRLAFYPQMRLKEWTIKRVLINSFSWAAYLLAYEFLFRGVLLFSCMEAFGFWPAVAINIALYSTTHIPKGSGETIGAIPYGLLLCYVSVLTGSIAVAFFTHLIMALSNEFFSVHHNPEMKFV